MARGNHPFLSFNRGILGQKALARVDLDRTRLSAETCTNFLLKTQGAMRIRPGTKHLGNSISDTGAAWVEFVAATDDTALLELTHQKMRVWVSSDTGHSWETPSQTGVEVPLARPKVDTVVTLADTGWSNQSTGGALATAATDIIPDMTAATTDGVTITANPENVDFTGESIDDASAGWRAADDDLSTRFMDTGQGEASTLPTWWKVNFGTDTGNRKSVRSYSIRAGSSASELDNTPKRWTLIASNFDTGTFSTDTGKWTLEDTQGSESAWAVGEKRTYRTPGGDTGTVEPRRYWRLTFLESNGVNELRIPEIEMFDAATAQQVKLQGGARVFNATSIGALARARKQVIVSDTGTEHSLAIDVTRGPITLRVGSTAGDDDYISETQIGTGYHNLAFTPQGNFHITLQHDGLVDRIVESLAIGDSGTVEITTAWDADDLENIRTDQSADVVYVDCADVKPHKTERRGAGRSWSAVELNIDNGPFLPFPSSSAKLSVSHKYGNTRMNSDVPFFKPMHVGALMRLFHGGQSGVWPLGALNAKTDPVEITGIGDTGTAGTNSERNLVVSVTGTYTGGITIERSIDGEDIGFHPASPDFMANAAAADTGTFTRTINDEDDNVKVWYRARLTTYSSGAALVTMTNKGGGINGIARITGYNSNTDVEVEVLSRFSDTGATEVWQEGAWSGVQQYPTSVALHGGRLAHAAGASLYMSVPDDFENFNDETIGDAAPVVRTLGSGPVDNVYYLISLLRLIIGTSGAEIEVRSSSLDEPVTPDNSSAKTFSTQGSANFRAVKMDTNAIFVQRSGQRVFLIGFGSGADALGGYEVTELTMLVPDLLSSGVVDIAIQRQPDTRIHCVLGNGKVAILTYEPQEEVLCWSLWETDGAVEKAMVLPGEGEDRVYYHINRTINGTTKRFLEKWAMESETEGDTGLSWIADCAKSYFDTGTTRDTFLHAAVPHLPGEAVVVWGDDTGAQGHGKDYSPDTGSDGEQRRFTADTGGDVTITDGSVHHAVVGLPFNATWKSTKLAYGAEAGTALAQMKRVGQIAFVLYRAHNNGLYFGRDTGHLDPMPRVIDAGAQVDADKIFETFDKVAFPFPGTNDPDARVVLRAKAPRPVTILAAVPTVGTNERV